MYRSMCVPMPGFSSRRTPAVLHTLGDARDEAVMQRLVGKRSFVKHLVVDGALLKVCDYAKQSFFPNSVLSIRDRRI